MWPWSLACADPGPRDYVLTGFRWPGGAAGELTVRDGHVAALGGDRPPGLAVVDLAGAFVAPAVVDSHVHLVYLPRASDLLDGGVTAVVDLAAPLDRRPRGDGLAVAWSGPMITGVRGYPTTSWGSDGYGVEVADPAAARAAARRHLEAGARVLKVPVARDGLPDDAVRAVVAEAHAAGVKVVAHALSAADADRAAALGVDGLAHTPVERLSEAGVAAWRGKLVVSTLAAFGGGADPVDNLRRLRAAGAVVLYGTDFGNTRTAGVDPEELRLLRAAGLDGAAILEAATATPARVWGFADKGALAPGAAADFLVLDADPSRDPSTLARPQRVFHAGAER